ncbi:MAG: diterpene synthase [Chloroflexi bacterium]|nr:diterpene synthase [Chloroflexota bacterium]
MISVEEFLSLPTEEVARLVRTAGPKVCVFPINGTRRWFRLEYPDAPDTISAYIDAMVSVHIRLCRLFFEHGLDTLIVPVFGPDLLKRRGYQEIALRGLSRLATDPLLRDFYSSNDIKVRFYGDYQSHFSDAPWRILLEQFEDLERETTHHQKHRLFLGVYAQDITCAITKITIEYYEKYGVVPTREKLVELNYGEYIQPADIFIGFDHFCVFDMPLLDIGETDLYFTVCPSPYITSAQLRQILYDHQYLRHGLSEEHESLGYHVVERMRNFYKANIEHTQGIGIVKDGIWFPTNQVDMPQEMQR